MDDKRIYVIVAETVQNPLEMKYIGGKHFIMRPTPETRTIVQPKGRIGAQIGHVTSKTRVAVVLTNIAKVLNRNATKQVSTIKEQIIEKLEEGMYPITTIVFAVPDSFQLEFRHFLLLKKGVKVFPFYDQNEDYGLGVVKTAICTEPVEREKLLGVTDYLQLWKDDNV